MTDLNFSHSGIRLGRTLFNLFALALDLPENFFDDKVHAILNCDSDALTPRRPLDLPRSCESSIIRHRILKTLTLGRLESAHTLSKCKCDVFVIMRNWLYLVQLRGELSFSHEDWVRLTSVTLPGFPVLYYSLARWCWRTPGTEHFRKMDKSWTCTWDACCQVCSSRVQKLATV